MVEKNKWQEDINEFIEWQESFETAKAKGVFPGVEEVKPVNERKEVIGPPTAQNLYWESLYNQISGDELLIEKEVSPTLDVPNPVRPDTLGKDQDQPKPQWVDNKDFEKLAKMKSDLYDLEVKLGVKDSGGNNNNSKEPIIHAPKNEDILKQIDSLRKRIDDMSDKFGLEGEWGSDTAGFDKLPPYDRETKRNSVSYDKR